MDRRAHLAEPDLGAIRCYHGGSLCRTDRCFACAPRRITFDWRRRRERGSRPCGAIRKRRALRVSDKHLPDLDLCAGRHRLWTGGGYHRSDIASALAGVAGIGSDICCLGHL